MEVVDCMEHVVRRERIVRTSWRSEFISVVYYADVCIWNDPLTQEIENDYSDCSLFY